MQKFSYRKYRIPRNTIQHVHNLFRYLRRLPTVVVVEAASSSRARILVQCSKFIPRFFVVVVVCLIGVFFVVVVFIVCFKWRLARGH